MAETKTPITPKRTAQSLAKKAGAKPKASSEPATPDEETKPTGEVPAEENEETMSVDDLRDKYPDAIAAIEEEVEARVRAELGDDEDTVDEPAATVAQLKAAFPDNPAHVIACLEKGRGMLGAKADLADELAKTNKNLEAKVGELTARLGGDDKALGNQGLSVDPVATGNGGETADGKGAYEAAIDAEMAADTTLTRPQAINAVNQKHPELRLKALG